MVYDISYHDNDTLQKVYKAMHEAGIDDKKMVDAVVKMQNAGILFRETATNRTVKFGAPEEPVQFAEMKPMNSPFTEEAMQQFWNREKDDMERVSREVKAAQDARSEHEERQDDASLD